jgi:hypothetical protein
MALFIELVHDIVGGVNDLEEHRSRGGEKTTAAWRVHRQPHLMDDRKH